MLNVNRGKLPFGGFRSAEPRFRDPWRGLMYFFDLFWRSLSPHIGSERPYPIKGFQGIDTCPRVILNEGIDCFM